MKPPKASRPVDPPESKSSTSAVQTEVSTPEKDVTQTEAVKTESRPEDVKAESSAPISPPTTASVSNEEAKQAEVPAKKPVSIKKDVSTLLPPGAGGETLPGSTDALPMSAPVDKLLPPGAEGGSQPGSQLPIPEEAQEELPPAPPDSILLPTAEGHMTAVSTKKKIINDFGEEMELEQLDADQKSSFRFKKNLIVWSFCAVVLVLTTLLLLRLS